ncbi:hypothetical protein LguiA_010959 [Lonicera macranthoides]
MESLMNTTETNTQIDGLSDPPTTSMDGSLFCRRIEFHLARKPFTGFSNGGVGFRLETLNPSSRTQKPGSNQLNGPLPLVGKKPEENGLDPELSFGIAFRRIVRIGAGLENLGNTCFLNSVLQCLTYTEPLAAYIQSGKHHVSCRTAGFCALCAIQKHVSRALQSTGRILAPKELVSNLRCISRNFRNSRQEDAHEYMVNLLESMHKCCLPAGVPSESPSAYEKSLVHKIFGGSLRSQVKCMQCNYCSDKFDPFLDLSLEIVKADSLYKALAHFTAKEQLDGGERHYQCQQCKQKVKALKQLTIHKAPDVLTIHLKRFGSHVQGQKIDKKILFGPTLDLKPFVTGPYDGDLKYNLYGVLVHAGWSTHSGHYFSFVRTSSGMWYNLDDNRVVQVSERKVLEQKAYMLFYSRDRRNFAPKKPVHIVQKENMAINAIGRNNPFSNFSQGLNKGSLHNGPINIRLNTANSSAAVAQRDALNACSLNETIMKEASIKKTNGSVIAEGSSDKDQAVSLDEAANGTLKLDNVTNTKTEAAANTKTVAETVSSCSNGITKKDLSNSIVILPNGNGSENPVTKKDLSDTAAKSVNCNENTSTKEDLSESSLLPSNCNVPNKSASDTFVAEMNSVEDLHKGLSLDVGGRTLEKIEPSSQTGDLTQNSSGGDLISRIKSSALIPTQTPLNKKALDQRPYKKRKKKHLVHQGTSMHLSSKILFGASVKLQKKKKHKRTKPCKSGIKNLSQEDFLNGDCIQTDLGPSTSEKPRAIIPHDGCAHSRRKGVSGTKSSKKKEDKVGKNAETNSNGDVLMVDKDFRERNGQNGAVLAAVVHQKITSTVSAGNQVDGREVSGTNDGGNDSTQNGLMSMLTRGLEETIVKRWDGMESCPSAMAESNGARSVKIGYIGDDWDEEYDRGKRKKVRGIKNSFGGPNPFQEIATTKANLKKAKLDHHHSSSANRPFRIK